MKFRNYFSDVIFSYLWICSFGSPARRYPRSDNLGKFCKRDLARGCRRTGQSRLNTPCADRISPIGRLTNGSRNRRASEALCIAAPDLGLDAARTGREAWPGFYARLRRLRRRRDQAKQSRQRIAPVLLPRAVRLRKDDQHAFLGKPCPGEALERRFRASSREAERSTSKRKCAAVSTLLTFCPPGPPARAKVKVSSCSSMAISGVISILGMVSPLHGAVSKSLTEML